MSGENTMTPYQRVRDVSIANQLFTQISAGAKLEKLLLFFDARVLDKYRETAGYKIIRTDTSGRVSKTGSWSVDFGISGEGDGILQVAVEGFIHRIPEPEREHWLDYMVTLPVSTNFIKGLIRPGCLDDGPIRAW